MKIEKDKLMHFLVCLAVAFFFSCLGTNVVYRLAPEALGLRILMGAAAGFVAAMLLGIEKEVDDSRMAGNHFCWKDLLADILGAAVGSLGGFVSYLF